MSWLQRFASSNIGLKVIMALTGFMMFGFVIVHMIGNLQVFLGPDTYNHYAEMLQGNPEIVWIARMGLLGAVLAHIGSAVALVTRSRAARPQGYGEHKFMGSSYAVRTMRFGGLILLLFIVFHLAQFTVAGVGVEGFQHCAWVGDDFTCYAYQNFVKGFQNPLVVGFYVVAQVFLGMHLTHGVWSMFRTLGLSNPRYVELAQKGAIAFGVLIAVGNIVMPIAALAGLLPQTDAILQNPTALR
jgi:succinate dehydrogenase / fumarate reductase cytochrome b subunit